ncbi:uncharacterized protein LOC131039625 [Cryptomeria japonica]|uniref:uncharacterized protein LOC131039625 n=1 Tax=Cryptomeria japonica TaxID=3369 RepID=UPI0027D9E6E0|nr:uncharacterized protein LOC131039625 [Cryptomeria japonica]
MAFGKKSGGAGLRDLVKRNKDFGGKLVWKMYTKANSKWCQIMQAKYLDSSNPIIILSISNPPDGSAMWNFMLSSRDVVTQFITWQIHNGESTNFRFDSWNGFPTLAQVPQLQLVIPIFIQKWGHKLINYVSGVALYSKKVIWKDIDIDIKDSLRRLIGTLLSQRTVILLDKEDKIIWSPSANGNYTVQNGYVALQHMMNQQQSQRDFFFSWNSAVMPKGGCFSWLALKNRILTSNKLAKLQIVQQFKYVMCDQVSEDVDHLFLQCPFAHQCWRFVTNKLELSMAFPNTIWDFFQAWPTLFK